MNKHKFQTSKVLFLSFTHLLHDIYTSILSPLLPLIEAKYGISHFMSGSLSVFQRIPSFANPLLGVLAERTNAKYFIIATPAFSALFMSLLGIAPNYYFIALLLFLSGISASLFHIPTPGLIKYFSGQKTGQGMSFFMLGGELARTLGPLIITYLILKDNSLLQLEETYKLMPLGIIASIVLYFKLRNSDYLKPKNKEKFKLKEALIENKSLFILLIFVTFFTGILKSSLALYIPLYLTESGTNLAFAGISLAVFQLAGAAGTLTSGVISDFIGTKTTLIISAIFTPALTFGFLYTSGILQIVFIILLGVFNFANMPVILAVINKYSKKNLSFINGTYFGISFFVSSASLLIIGFAADVYNFFVAFHIAGILNLGLIPTIIILHKKLKIN